MVDYDSWLPLGLRFLLVFFFFPIFTTTTRQCIDFSKDGKTAVIGVTKKLLVVPVDGTGEPSKTRDLPSVINSVVIHESKHSGTMMAVCGLKSAETLVLDMSVSDPEDIVYELHAVGDHHSVEIIAVVCNENKIVVGNSNGKITIVPHPLVHTPRFVEVEWLGLFRLRPHLLLQHCCIDYAEDGDDADEGGGKEGTGMMSSITGGITGAFVSIENSIEESLEEVGSALSKKSSTGEVCDLHGDMKTITPLHLMDHNSFRKLMDVLPPCHSVALCPRGCRQSLLDCIFNNREHEKCMTIAKIYPIERADNEAGEKFADWLVRLCGVYDDVIALAIMTGVVVAPGALPREKDKLRRVLPSELYKPYHVLNIDAMSEHNKQLVDTETTRDPVIKPETKAPLHPRIDSWHCHKPLWEYPHGVGKKKIKGPKIAVEAVAVGPPEFVRRTFPHLAKAGSVEVFQTEIMGVVVNFLWHRVRRYYVRQWRQFLLLLCAFALGVFLDLWVHEQPDYKNEMTFFQAIVADHSITPRYPMFIILSRCCLFISFFMAVVFLFRELRQMRLNGMSEYFASGWNCLELTGYGFVTLNTIWYAFNLPWSNIVTCISVMILICTTMVHLRGFSSYSPIITTFLQIVSDMKAFFSIVLLLWIGGTLAFKALMPGRADFQGSMALWSVWQMVLGDVMSSSLKYQEQEYWKSGDMSWAVATATTGKVLSGCFVLVVVVILMNQLIALMGDSYDRVQENYVVQARISRARVIVDMMDLYVEPSDEQVFARWIHVLRPAGAHGRNGKDGWQGRLKAVKKAVQAAQQKLEEKLTEEMQVNFHALEASLGYKMDALLLKMQGNVT